MKRRYGQLCDIYAGLDVKSVPTLLDKQPRGHIWVLPTARIVGVSQVLGKFMARWPTQDHGKIMARSWQNHGKFMEYRLSMRKHREYDTKPTPVFVRVYVRLGVGSEAKPICGFVRQIHTHGFFKGLKPHQILPETAVNRCKTHSLFVAFPYLSAQNPSSFYF